MSFSILDTSDIQSIVMKNDFTKLEISKTDIATGTELPGAHLALYDESQFDENGKLLDSAVPCEEWVSSATPHYIEKIPVGKYVLVETIAPDGYVRAESITFNVEEVAEKQKVEMKNDYTKLSVEKLDGDTKEFLPGAVLAIYKENDFNEYGELNSEAVPFATWTTSDKEHKLERIPVGKYVLVETSVPDGYVKVAGVPFEIKETAEIQSITMKNFCTKLQILKVDMMTEEPLPGAKLELYYDSNNNGVVDADEKLIDSWESAEKAHIVTHVIPGNYLIVETEAPEGYEVFTVPVKILVLETSDIQQYIVNNLASDEILPPVIIPNPEIPETDASNAASNCFVIILPLFILAFAMVFTTSAIRKKARK